MPFNFGGGSGQSSSNSVQNQQPTGGGGFQFDISSKDRKNNQIPAELEAPKKLPFMALENDKYGLPYYGEGVQGFARKTFAKIFDPGKLLPKPTEQQARLIEQAGQMPESEAPGWSKFVSKWTGIQEGELAQAAVAINLATKGTDAEGNPNDKVNLGSTVSTLTGTMYRGGGQVIATGLEALSISDKASRKVQAFNTALDDIGDASSVLPDIQRAEESMVKLFGDTALSHRVGNVIDAIGDMNPVTGAYNLIRAAVAGGSLQQKFTTVKNTLRASNMQYTMYWDEAKKDEYMRRMKAGENPDLLMRELENPWVELAGSVIGDPATYMGMGLIGNVGKTTTPVRFMGKTIFKVPWEVVGRVPGMTEILGLKNIGKARLLNSADEFIKAANPETEKALMALAETADDADAFAKVQTAMNAVRKQVREFAGVFDETATLAEKKKALAGAYGFFTHDANGKTNMMKKTVGTVMQAMAGRFRNTDDILETFKAYKNITSTDDKVALRAFHQLKEMYGTMPFSHAGMQAMEFISRTIDDVDIPAMVAKHGDDIPAFADDAMKKIYSVIDDMYPSIDDMALAAQDAKALGKGATERQKFLAKAYEDLKQARPQAIWSNNVVKSLTQNKAYQGLQGFYANTLMGMRPAYAFRNLISNTVHIWHDLGTAAGVEAFTTGVEVFAKSTVGRALKQDWVTPVIEREAGRIEQILGFIPTRALEGTGSAGLAKGFGFLAVGQDVEKVHSVILSRYVVETEMEKALRYGGIPALDGVGLPKEAAERLYTHALETFGDVKQTLSRFRAEQATGYAEVWRNLELDPDFKDTMRRSGLLDELENIRKTAPDPVAFSDQMKAFIKKIDDLAARTANEPALVSADNPLADVVVTLEKAFDEGGRKMMSEGELNQFRALVELRGQLRNAYQDYADVMKDRIGRLIPPDQMPQFEQRFSQLRQTLENGNTKWRAYADDLYRGIYAQSRKGTPPSELWGQVRNVMLDVDEAGKPVLKRISMADDFQNVNPAELTSSEFNGMMWKWFKEKQSAFWRSYTQSSMIGQDAILEDMAKFAGANLDEIRKAEFIAENNPRLQTIRDLTKQIGDWEQHLDYDSFARVQPSSGEINAALNTSEEAARAAGNVNAPPPIDQKVTISNDVGENPLSILQQGGGVRLEEFSDVMGGKSGVDRAGVMPGLFTKNGMGIDDAGRLLWENGFITAEQADDVNFVREFIRNPSRSKSTTFIQEGARLSQMDLSNVPNWEGGKKHLFNAVNAERAAKQLEPYATIDDVPFDEAAQVLKKKTNPIPPYVEGTQPTVTRQLLENMKGGLRDVMQGFTNTTIEKWGQRVPIDSNLTDEAEAALAKWAAEMDRRSVSNRAAVASIANATRDFILHDYNKTYGDKFAGLFTMYHYWGSRNYARWAERVADTPGTLAAYAKWKATMEKVHSDQPEFYRYNLPIGKLPGMNNGPMYFNLEAALNPLYSITGVDFNDPKRRVDWMSTAVDDMGKFGFNVSMPLQWAMAFRLYRKGEDEAARRWMGRLIPATQDLKAGLNLLKEETGIDLMPDIGILPGAKYGDFDPFVNAQGGADAYEEKRIGRALSAMVMQGEVTKEQALDIMYKREGPAYDEAVYRAINERAPGQMASFFLGVGFKSRTEGDMMVEEFQSKYYTLLAQRENMSPEDYRERFNELKDDYDFADTVLLSSRGGDDRDSAYAYNVIGRLPPGDSYKVLAEMGVSADMLNKFYQDKGDFSDWTPQDKNRFMGAMLDMGATFALPDGATRQEWDAARTSYQNDVRGQISQTYGEEVWNTLSTYYDLMDTNKDQAGQFKADHPEINGALQLKRELIISNPLVYKYYGSFDTIEAYFDGKMRAQLAEKFGEDITDKQTMYFNLKTESPAEANKFLAQHPEIKAYWSEKKKLEAPLNQAMVEFATGLEDGTGAQLRSDFSPANASQEQIAQFSGSQAQSYEDLSASFSDGLNNQILNYWQTGEPLSKAALSELDFQSQKLGFYNADSLLRELGLALQSQTGQPAAPQSPQGFQFSQP